MVNLTKIKSLGFELFRVEWEVSGSAGAALVSQSREGGSKSPNPLNRDKDTNIYLSRDGEEIKNIKSVSTSSRGTASEQKSERVHRDFWSFEAASQFILMKFPQIRAEQLVLSESKKGRQK